MAVINPENTVELAVIFFCWPLYYPSLDNTRNNSTGICLDNIVFSERITRVWKSKTTSQGHRFHIHNVIVGLDTKNGTNAFELL